MKLLYCPNCEDVVRLTNKVRTCECGRVCGLYIDRVNAIYNRGIPLGIDWTTFLDVLDNQPEEGMGKVFEAFVIPRICPTMIEITREEVMKYNK
jgi:hypothetical protein